jgi:hypothetical protein
VGFGRIVGLVVHGAEPVFSEQTEVLVDLKLDGCDAPRPEQDLEDFVLSSGVSSLLSKLDDIRDGTIEQVEIRAGVPRRIVFRVPDLTHS